MTSIRHALSFVGIAAILVTLSACVPPSNTPSPAPSPSVSASAGASSAPTPSATAVPTARASSIIVDGDSVSVKNTDGGIIIDIPFSTDPTTAVAQLNTATGLTGTVSVLSGSGSCFKDRQQATWGGLDFTWGDDWQRAPGALFIARATGPSATNGLAVTLPSGHAVGASQSDVIAAYSTAHRDDYGAWINLDYDAISGTFDGNPDTYYGALAIIKNGALASFASPIHYNYDC